MSRTQAWSIRGQYISFKIPWLNVNQTLLLLLSAVPTPVLALDVHRAGIPGPPGAELLGVTMLFLFFFIYIYQPPWFFHKNIFYLSTGGLNSFQAWFCQNRFPNSL
jgi:hypothetical protein